MTFLIVTGLIVILLIAGIRYMTSMPGASYRGGLPSLSDRERQIRDRLTQHVYTLAGEIGERNVWRKGALDAAAEYIEAVFAELGYEVGTQRYEVYGKDVRNIEVEIGGQSRAGEIVVVGAHYDSVMGSPGANDNGSGVAAVLELGRLLAARQLERTLRLVTFVNEEPPFYFSGDMGSRQYARRCRRRKERVVAMLSLETIGYYSDAAGSQAYPFPFGLLYPRTGNFIAFVGNLRSRALVRRSIGAFRAHASFPSEAAAAPGYMPGIYWSDHWSFWREGYRAAMVTDTAPFRYPHYHTGSDTPDEVDYERLARVVVGLVGVAEELAGR